MNAEVKKLINFVKDGNLEEAKKVADSLLPPEHKSDQIQRWLATYSYITGIPIGQDEGYETTKEYQLAINFMKQIGTPDNYDLNFICTEVLWLMEDKAADADAQLILTSLFINNIDFIQRTLIPHLQDLGIYPIDQHSQTLPPPVASDQ